MVVDRRAIHGRLELGGRLGAYPAWAAEAVTSVLGMDPSLCRSRAYCSISGSGFGVLRPRRDVRVVCGRVLWRKARLWWQAD